MQARNGAEAKTCLAMPRHSVVGTLRIEGSLKIFLETVPAEDANSAISSTSTKAGAIRFTGNGDNVARACASTAILVPPKRILGFCRHLSPPENESELHGEGRRSPATLRDQSNDQI